MAGTEPVDVVVIGSGAGGGPIAWQLARAGVSVVVLEKGRERKAAELVHDEIAMCRRNFFIPYFKDEPHTIRHSQTDKAMRTNECWTSNILGGGTVHMSGYFMRMQPVDFRLRSTLGKVDGANVADWPFTYEDLEPFYAMAEREMGVSGQWKRHPFEEPRSSDYPMPPLKEHPYSQKVDEACARLGFHAFPTPRGIASVSHKGRAPCMYCALCGSFGCEMSAKASSNVTVLPEAVATGKCEIRTECMAVDIPVDNKTGKVTGVTYRNSKNETVFQPARAVVVACSAVETARLLLISRSGKYPKGLANGSGQVGKNLLFSSLAKGHALFSYAKRKADETWMRDSAPFLQRSMQDFYYMDQPVEGVRKGGTILFAFYHPNPINTVERVAGGASDGVWGKALKQKIRDEARGARCLDFETFGEFLATDQTYVDLDDEAVDKWGLPAARITIGRHPHDLQVSALLGKKGMSVLEALGPDSTKMTITRGETKILQGGTCRAGTDPATSVIDKDCRSHEVSNLWIGDGSFMPTSGGVPFTLTIMANAFRVGQRMVDAFKAGKL